MSRRHAQKKLQFFAQFSRFYTLFHWSYSKFAVYSNLYCEYNKFVKILNKIDLKMLSHWKNFT